MINVIIKIMAKIMPLDPRCRLALPRSA